MVFFDIFGPLFLSTMEFALRFGTYKKCPIVGNVHDEGIVYVTASSVYKKNDSSNHPKNAVDLGTESKYYSNDEKDTWICYDFKERRVIPTSYSVMSLLGPP